MTPWKYGSTFSYQGHSYRVTSFAKVETWSIGTEDVHDQILREILIKEGKNPDALQRLVFCTPEEAEIVVGYGVSGIMLPIHILQPAERTVYFPEEEASARSNIGREMRLHTPVSTIMARTL